MVIQCAIIDDVSLIRKNVEHYIKKAGILKLVGSFESVEEASDALKSGEIELLFLDVELPGVSGMEFLRSMKDGPNVILMTSYENHAVEAFELNVIDYLLKPITFDRFLIAVEKAQNIIERETGKLDNNEIFIRSDSSYVKLRVEDIKFVEAFGDYVNINTAEKIHKVHSTMKAMETKLGTKKFIRVHRSYIIPLDKIDQIEDNVIRMGTMHVPIGRSYKDELMRCIKVV